MEEIWHQVLFPGNVYLLSGIQMKVFDWGHMDFKAYYSKIATANIDNSGFAEISWWFRHHNMTQKCAAESRFLIFLI